MNIFYYLKIAFIGVIIMVSINSFAGERIKLPKPNTTGTLSLEDALVGRRSIRDFNDKPVTLDQISQLLWSAQGITSPSGKRTAPSAGALYPLEVYIIVWRAEGLKSGIYHFSPGYNESYLELLSEGNFHNELLKAVRG